MKTWTQAVSAKLPCPVLEKYTVRANTYKELTEQWESLCFLKRGCVTTVGVLPTVDSIQGEFVEAGWDLRIFIY